MTGLGIQEDVLHSLCRHLFWYHLLLESVRQVAGCPTRMLPLSPICFLFVCSVLRQDVFGLTGLFGDNQVAEEGRELGSDYRSVS